MSFEQYLSFLVIATIIIIVPGPNVTLILATSALRGIRAGLGIVAGTNAAQMVQVLMVALGLSWLVQTFGTL